MSTLRLDYCGEAKVFLLTNLNTVEQVNLLVRSSYWRVPLDAFTLKYIDEDGDFITVATTSDWNEMLRCARLLSRSEVTVFIIPPKTSSAVVNQQSQPKSIVDGEQSITVATGSRFRHSWQLRNVTATSWPEGSRMQNVSGELFGSFPTFMVASMRSDEETTIEMNFVAPSTIGEFRTSWRVFSPSGEPLSNVLSVCVRTSSQIESSVFPGLPHGEVFNVFPGLHYSSPDVSTTLQKPFFLESSQHFQEVPSRRSLQPGVRFSYSWLLRNTTTAAFPDGCRARLVAGHSFGTFDNFLVPSLSAGAQHTIELGLVAPATAGQFDAQWAIFAPDNSRIDGTTLRISITVMPASPNASVGITANATSSSTSSSSSTSTSSSTSSRHPALNRITCMSDEELNKLMRTFVDL